MIKRPQNRLSPYIKLLGLFIFWPVVLSPEEAMSVLDRWSV